jgi:hypothetical protein
MNNPTNLRVGATGVLSGMQFKVVGRVVMGMEQGGATYYWQEFNLLDTAGRRATLVFEETENGPEWKLFQMFDPIRPLTVAEAARKQVGDIINLDGNPTAITLVDESRVYDIEGDAPEGVEVGDVARYFNADAGDRMLVVSWTGDEIEYYRGVDVPAQLVAAAFGLAPQPAPGGMRTAAAPSVPPSLMGAWVVIAIVAGTAIAGYLWWRHPRARSAPLAGGLGLTVQYPGGQRFWFEYRAADGALFLNGLTGHPQDWHRFRPVPPTLTPRQAGGKRTGDSVEFDGETMRVQQLFWAADKFGFWARAGNEFGLARWTETGIEFYRGQPVTEQEARAALGQR